MEPRASRPDARLRAIRELAEAGIPVGVMAAPVIPGLNDHEIPAVLSAASDAGARTAGYTVVRLMRPVDEIFSTWLAQHFPGRRERILGRIRDAHGGQLGDSRFGIRMTGEGAWAETFRALFRLTRARLGYGRLPELSASAFRRPGFTQGSLFDAFDPPR
jgi:DNA repair photolyase